MKADIREAYEKSLKRWERIHEIFKELRGEGLRCDGSRELRIPECAMCSIFSHANDGGGCDACSWFDNCDREGSEWKSILKSTEFLEKEVEAYLKKAREHFVSISTPKKKRGRPPKKRGRGRPRKKRGRGRPRKKKKRQYLLV